MQLINIRSTGVTEKDMAKCPICNGYIYPEEQGTLVTAFNVVCLAHTECVAMEIEDDGETLIESIAKDQVLAGEEAVLANLKRLGF